MADQKDSRAGARRPTQHTPGPWYVGAQNDALYIITRPPRPSRDDIVDIPDVKVIAIINVCNDDANARLIAAAPALLAALCEAVTAVEPLRIKEHGRDTAHPQPGPGECERGTCGLVNGWRAAIRAATEGA